MWSHGTRDVLTPGRVDPSRVRCVPSVISSHVIAVTRSVLSDLCQSHTSQEPSASHARARAVLAPPLSNEQRASIRAVASYQHAASTGAIPVSACNHQHAVACLLLTSMLPPLTLTLHRRRSASLSSILLGRRDYISEVRSPRTSPSGGPISEDISERRSDLRGAEIGSQSSSTAE